MSNNKEHNLQKKLNYLYDKLDIIADHHNHNQMDFLMQEIDAIQTELLKLETYQHYKEIEEDAQEH